jgi:hypothetical protein
MDQQSSTAAAIGDVRLAEVIEHLPMAAGVVDGDCRLIIANHLMAQYGAPPLPAPHGGRQRWRAVGDAGNAAEPDRWPVAQALSGHEGCPSPARRCARMAGASRAP